MPKISGQFLLCLLLCHFTFTLWYIYILLYLLLFLLYRHFSQLHSKIARGIKTTFVRSTYYIFLLRKRNISNWDNVIQLVKSYTRRWFGHNRDSSDQIPQTRWFTIDHVTILRRWRLHLVGRMRRRNSVFLPERNLCSLERRSGVRRMITTWKMFLRLTFIDSVDVPTERWYRRVNRIADVSSSADRGIKLASIVRTVECRAWSETRDIQFENGTPFRANRLSNFGDSRATIVNCTQ